MRARAPTPQFTSWATFLSVRLGFLVGRQVVGFGGTLVCAARTPHGVSVPKDASCEPLLVCREVGLEPPAALVDVGPGVVAFQH